MPSSDLDSPQLPAEPVEREQPSQADDVVYEAPASGEQRRIFEARDAGAEMSSAHG